MYEVLLNGERVALCNGLELAENYQQATPGSIIVSLFADIGQDNDDN